MFLLINAKLQPQTDNVTMYAIAAVVTRDFAHYVTNG